jgi:hypothetical protein
MCHYKPGQRTAPTLTSVKDRPSRTDEQMASYGLSQFGWRKKRKVQAVAET